MISLKEVLEIVDNYKSAFQFEEISNFLEEQLLDHFRSRELYRELVNTFRKLHSNTVDKIKELESIPYNDTDYHNRGTCWIELKQPERAVYNLSRSIEINNRSPETYSNRGLAYTQLGDFKNAKKDFDKAIELNPKFIGTYANYAILLANYNNIDETIRICSDIINSGNYTHHFYGIRALALNESGEYDSALLDIGKAIEMEPRIAVNYRSRATIFKKREKYEEALNDLLYAIQIEPDNGTSYFDAAEIYFRLHKNVAINYYKKAYSCGDVPKHKFIRIFTEFSAPSLLKDVLFNCSTKRIMEQNGIDLKQMIQEIKAWDKLYDFLLIKNIPKNSYEYYVFDAVVSYYLGNSVSAFRIFDEKIDNDTLGDRMSIRDQYYFALSAIDFMEPIDGIVYYAIESFSKIGKPSSLDLYYIGRIYLLIGDCEKAKKNFKKCKDFLPAKYAMFSLTQSVIKEKDLHILATEIKDANDNLPANESLLYGVAQIVIKFGDSFEEIFSKVMHLILYYECLQEIQTVRFLLNINLPFNHVEFSDALIFQNDLDENISSLIEKNEMKIVENVLESNFEAISYLYYKSELIKEFSSTKASFSVFSRIESVLNNNASNVDIEKVIAIHILKPETECAFYCKLICYYYLSQKISLKSAVSLYVYLIKVYTMTNHYLGLDRDGKRDILKRSDVLGLLSIPMESLFKTASAIVKYLKLNLEKEDVWDDSSDYEEFKANFYRYLSFLTKQITFQSFDKISDFNLS